MLATVAFLFTACAVMSCITLTIDEKCNGLLLDEEDIVEYED